MAGLPLVSPLTRALRWCTERAADEDTAAVFHNDGHMDVIGRHSVTVVDGSDMYSDIFRVKGHGEVTVSNARLHVLPAGRAFDLRARTMIDE